MNEIYDEESLALFYAGSPNPELRSIVEEQLERAKQQGLWHLTIIIALTHCESLADLTLLLGFNPLEEQWWDWIRDHNGWLEVGMTAGNTGFAWIVLVPRCSTLGQFCCADA